MTILVTGSLGKTSSRLAEILSKEKQPFIVASRSGKAASYPAVRFDYDDSSTYELPFSSPEAQKLPIRAVWLVGPVVADPYPVVKAFIDFAKAKGVKRFVLLSASPAPEGEGTWFGKTHAYLKGLGVEWTVLRPTWFMQNFSEEQFWHPTQEENRVVTATGDGKLPFVAAEDIAAVAARALTDEKPHNTEHIVLGPELLRYQDAADVLSDVLGRKIECSQVSQEELAHWLTSRGVPEETSNMLAAMDIAIKNGMEDRLNDTVEKVTGKKPMTFREFAEKYRDVF